MMPFSVVSYMPLSGTWYDWECMFLECLRGGESLSLLLTATLSWEILYIMTRHASLCRSSRLRHLRCCSMSPTLDVLRCLLVTYLASLHWSVSILLMSDLRWGSHTEQAYSSDGLTNDLYACSLTEVEPMFRLWRKKPRVLLAFPQMLLMWLYHRCCRCGFTTDVVDVALPQMLLMWLYHRCCWCDFTTDVVDVALPQMLLMWLYHRCCWCDFTTDVVDVALPLMLLMWLYHRCCWCGFATDVVDVAFPFEVLTDCNSQIFCLINWNTHINNITSKAQKLLGFLRRNPPNKEWTNEEHGI
jgi:hypothetical protein